ncbi:MAG: competence/damage-inducible protein A [Phycisphaerae bacterium]
MPLPTCAVLSVGDELVLGQTIDTNSAWLSEQLSAVGIESAAHATVGDDQAAVVETLQFLAKRHSAVIISGGLGPTEDDLTRQALAELLQSPLELRADWLGQLRTFFEARGRPMPERNAVQAMIPAGAELIWNDAGTAAGVAATWEGCRLFAVPGVPKEMKKMVREKVLPRLAELAGGRAVISTMLNTFGLGESDIAERLGELMARGRNPSIGTTVSRGIVSVRVNSRGESLADAQEMLLASVTEVRDRLGTLIFSENDRSLPEAVAPTLITEGLTVTTAESCTGGLIATMLTDVPGSSGYFKQGFVTYSNEAKTAMLGVPAELLAKHGAVSEPVVRAMAEGARQRTGADVALAVSGIAGPSGETENKPVGTVHVALSDVQGVWARRYVFPGDRPMVRDRTAKTALALLRYRLLGETPPF